MPILQTVIRIRWTPNNKDYYEEKGYTFSSYYKDFKVLVKDLSDDSNYEVVIQCDFCKKIIKKAYCRCIDICNCNDKECVKKRKEQTNLKRYGVKCVFESQYIQSKIVNTLKHKYGVERISDIPGIYEKIQKTAKSHNNIPISKQQKRLHKIFGGVLNYIYENYAIDIALLDEKIAIEYNGSGHDLNLQKKRITEEEFLQHENNRKEFLLANNWKLLIISSKDDELPSDSVLKRLFTFAINKFLININYIEINFDAGTVLFDDYVISIRQALTKE